MNITFADGQTLEGQDVIVSEQTMTVSVINNVCEQLVFLFSNPETTKKIVTDDGRVLEGYTEYQGVNVAPGMIYTVTMCQKGKSPEQRLDAIEQTSGSNAEQVTQNQEAICELYEMVIGGDV